MAAAQYKKDLEREAGWMTDWAGNKPSDGNGSSVDPGAYTLPERKDLPTVLGTFQSELQICRFVKW